MANTLIKEALESSESDLFRFTPGSLGGKDVTLVTPIHNGIKWNKKNLILRSVIYTNDTQEIVSLGFKKFFNWKERTDVVADPVELTGIHAVEKIDGSTLIVSKFNNQLIARTRGTMDATRMANGHELKLLQDKYPLAFSPYSGDTWPMSYIYEWVTPENRVVIGHEAPDIYLVGGIFHETGEYVLQDWLDIEAERIGVKRPKIYTMDKADPGAFLDSIAKMENTEGCCLYFNNDQDIKKGKTEWYLMRHRAKFNCTYDNMIDMFLEMNTADHAEIDAKLTEVYDFECMPVAQHIAKQVGEACQKARDVVKEILDYTNEIKRTLSLNSKLNFRERKKQAATMVYAKYSKNPLYLSVCFTLFDKNDIERKLSKKLIEFQLESIKNEPSRNTVVQ